MKCFGSLPCLWLLLLLQGQGKWVGFLGNFRLCGVEFCSYSLRIGKFFGQAQDYSMHPCCWHALSFILMDRCCPLPTVGQDCLQLILNHSDFSNTPGYCILDCSLRLSVVCSLGCWKFKKCFINYFKYAGMPRE